MCIWAYGLLSVMVLAGEVSGEAGCSSAGSYSTQHYQSPSLDLVRQVRKLHNISLNSMLGKNSNPYFI